MEAASVVQSASLVYSRQSAPVGRLGFLSASGPDLLRVSSSSPIRQFSTGLGLKSGRRSLSLRSRRSPIIRASASSSSSSRSSGSDGSIPSIAPLQLESPVGQFLSQILVSHPHLVPAAVEQQLEQLQTDRDGEKKDEPAAAGTDLVLYRRIAEVKANERRKTLEEILYALIVQKFMDANVSLIPTLSQSDRSGSVDTWASKEEKKLEQLHSPEAFEMIQNHLTLILGNRLGDPSAVAQISKLRVGQVYAASVMYGYFLKRVDQRFQLEKTMKVLPSGSDKGKTMEYDVKTSGTDGSYEPVSSSSSPSPHPEVAGAWAGGISPDGFGSGMKPSRLRSYVMSFDGDTLQRYATIRSKEAVTIIEKHTEALFGRPEIAITPEGTIDMSKDENIKISFSGLKRLVLEAVTFGSFLWDAEGYVDSRYHFVMN
ncbi:UV-B-induced protein At3g17800, chloroplastic [Linum perenne]